MKVLIVSATDFEVIAVRKFLEQHGERSGEGFHLGQHSIYFLITGVGMAATGIALGRTLFGQEFDLAINVGIAGSFHRHFPIGTVVEVTTERFADLGASDADGSFLDLNDLRLPEPFESQNGLYVNPNPGIISDLKTVNGITVNKCHGTKAGIEAVINKYPDTETESMEGGAFFLACLQSGVRFNQIRAISNSVEVRDRDAWDIPLALDRLTTALTGLFIRWINQKTPSDSL